MTIQKINLCVLKHL